MRRRGIRHIALICCIPWASPGLAPAAEPPPPADADGGYLVEGLVTAGAVAGLAVGLGLNFAARDRLDEGNRLDGLYQLTLDEELRVARDEADDEARALASVSYITLGIGAALAGVAVWLWLSDDDPEPQAAMLTVGPDSIGILTRF